MSQNGMEAGKVTLTLIHLYGWLPVAMETGIPANTYE